MKSAVERLQTEIGGVSEAWMEGGADEEQIRLLERKLSVQLPPSYRRFLSEMGAVELRGIFVAGIINHDALDLSGGSAYGDTVSARTDLMLPTTLLVIQADDDAPHCIDLSSADPVGEMTVVCFESHCRSVQVVARNFEHWLDLWVLAQIPS